MHTTLPSLVEKMRELELQEKKAMDEGLELPDSNYWEKEICTKLLAGKIDAAAELRKGVEERIDALKMALKGSQELLMKLDDSFFQAVDMSESKRLDGLAWSAKVQINSKASVVIDEPLKIPLEFRKLDVCLTAKFPANDLKEKRFWVSMILRRHVQIEDLNKLSAEDQAKVSESMSEFFSKADIEASLKNDSASVPGARLHKGSHLRIMKGEAKISNGNLLTTGGSNG